MKFALGLSAALLFTFASALAVCERHICAVATVPPEASTSGPTGPHSAFTSAQWPMKEYQLRGVIGEEWDEDDVVTIEPNGPEAPREFTVNFGLTQPVTSIVLKVYVITEPGRERGSAPLRVDRV